MWLHHPRWGVTLPWYVQHTIRVSRFPWNRQSSKDLRSRARMIPHPSILLFKISNTKAHTMCPQICALHTMHLCCGGSYVQLERNALHFEGQR